MLRILKIFLAGFCILVLAIVLPILAYGGWAAWALSFPHVSRNEVYAHQVMQDLSPDHVISVCGKPASDVVVDYGDWKSRILVYLDFEANFSLKDGHWQYDFIKDGNGPMPDSRMLKRYEPIKLPCQQSCDREGGSSGESVTAVKSNDFTSLIGAIARFALVQKVQLLACDR